MRTPLALACLVATITACANAPLRSVDDCGETRSETLTFDHGANGNGPILDEGSYVTHEDNGVRTFEFTSFALDLACAAAADTSNRAAFTVTTSNPAGLTVHAAIDIGGDTTVYAPAMTLANNTFTGQVSSISFRPQYPDGGPVFLAGRISIAFATTGSLAGDMAFFESRVTHMTLTLRYEDDPGQ